MLDDQQLTDVLEAHLWSMWGPLGSCRGGKTTDMPARLLVETPIPRPPYNTVLRFLDDGSPLDAQVDEVLARYVDRPVTLAWIVHPSSPDGLGDLLAARGLEMAEELFGMAVDLTEIAEPLAFGPDVEVFEASLAHAAEWMEMVGVRYELDPADSDLVRQLMEDQIDHARWFVARVDGVAVSKVVLHEHDGVAGIYGVATTEAGRGRGLAGGLTAHALGVARESGMELGVLHSTPMAQSLYRSIGFRDVATFEVWALPGSVQL
ncbi:MAG: GNAT family N-acetyltransferase [Ilumatobacter sp.]